jgi:hypothetical protein
MLPDHVMKAESIFPLSHVSYELCVMSFLNLNHGGDETDCDYILFLYISYLKMQFLQIAYI